MAVSLQMWSGSAPMGRATRSKIVVGRIFLEVEAAQGQLYLTSSTGVRYARAGSYTGVLFLGCSGLGIQLIPKTKNELVSLDRNNLDP